MQDKITFHIIANTDHYLDGQMSSAWIALQKGLVSANSCGFELTSLVLMSNHYHMLVKLPYSKLFLFMAKLSTQIDATFYWKPIFSPKNLQECYRYIYRNPLNAGIVESSEDYRFSTLYYIKNNLEFAVQIYDRFGVKDEYFYYLLNTRSCSQNLSRTS